MIQAVIIASAVASAASHEKPVDNVEVNEPETWKDKALDGLAWLLILLPGLVGGSIVAMAGYLVLKLTFKAHGI